MRSTLDICIAVQDEQPATEHELRLCVASLSAINHFLKQNLRNIIEANKDNKTLVPLRIGFASTELANLFDAQKRPMDVWLGRRGTPGTPEHREEQAWAKRIFEKATGQKLP